MQIKMIGTFSYDVVPGSTRRTLHQGLVLEEAADVATAAIAAGAAVRWPPEVLAHAGEGDDGGAGSGGDDKTPAAPNPAAAKTKGGKGKSKPEASPPPEPAAPEPAPAEPVEPGAGG